MLIIDKKPTTGIVLAAGMSKRFGSPKQLIKINGRYILEWILDACLNSNLAHVYLVLGYKDWDVRKSLSCQIPNSKMSVVINCHYGKKPLQLLRKLDHYSPYCHISAWHWYHYWYYISMTKIDDILIGMKRNPKNVRFVDLCKVCENYFGKPRNRGSSHKIFKPPGKAIQGLIFKTTKERPRHIK